MRFSHQNKTHTTLSLKIQNQILERTTYTKFRSYILGLKWSTHITYVSKKVSKNIVVLYKLRKDPGLLWGLGTEAQTVVAITWMVSH